MFIIDQFNKKTININTISNHVKDYLNQKYIFVKQKEKLLSKDSYMVSIEGARETFKISTITKMPKDSNNWN